MCEYYCCYYWICVVYFWFLAACIMPTRDVHQLQGMSRKSRTMKITENSTWPYGSFRLAEHNQNIWMNMNNTLYPHTCILGIDEYRSENIAQRYRSQCRKSNRCSTFTVMTRCLDTSRPAVAIEKHIPIALCQSWAHALPVHKGEQMQRTGEELGNVDAKCWPNALAQVLEWNNCCLQSHVAQKQESTTTILDNIQQTISTA